MVNRGTMDVNSLPKSVTRQRRGCDLNTGPSAPESSTLTTRLPSQPFITALHVQLMLHFQRVGQATAWIRVLVCMHRRTVGSGAVRAVVCVMTTQLGRAAQRDSWHTASSSSSSSTHRWDRCRLGGRDDRRPGVPR